MSAVHKSEKSEKHESSSQKVKKRDANLKLVSLLVVVLIGVLLAVWLGSTNNDKKNTSSNNNNSNNTATNGNAELYTKPAEQSVTAGESLTFEIWVNTAGQPVNAVQANLTYPSDKFDFNSIDTKGSAFEIQAMSKGGNGSISIARGHVGNVKGQALLAKIVLVAKTSKGDAKIEFTSGSAVVRSTDHKDILKDKTGGTFEISKLSSPFVVASAVKNKIK